jgi:hypothetical protein
MFYFITQELMHFSSTLLTTFHGLSQDRAFGFVAVNHTAKVVNFVALGSNVDLVERLRFRIQDPQ